MYWKKISIKLLVPFVVVFLVCLYAIRSLGLMINCDCFISQFGTLSVCVVGLLSLISSVPTVLVIKKDWKSTYTLFVIFLFITMVIASWLIGEKFYNPPVF